MKKSFSQQIDILIQESDILLEILDSRFPDKTRNEKLEKKILGKRKKLIVVLNKADLRTKEELEETKRQVSSQIKARIVFISAKDRDGINLLKREIAIAKGSNKTAVIGLLGYPNSGKSTLINALAGAGRARVRVSRKAGFTRGLQRIKVEEGIYLIDAPGIIPIDKKDEFDLFLVSARNPNQLKDVETIAIKMIQFLGKKKLSEKFGISESELEKLDEEETLEAIAIKKSWLATGGKGNVERAARELLEMFQRNEI